MRASSDSCTNAAARVQILLSTYNGERYLEPLLKSLFRQTYPHLSILVRDDGSTDGTVGLLERYAESERLRVYRGLHVGIRRSFFDLLTHADPTCRFFAFCDQDDVWLPEKVARAHAFLAAAENGQPVLYCSRAILVDEGLRPFGLTRGVARGPSFENALVENIATGCTTVLNRASRLLLVSSEPSCETMHDRWAYLVVAAIGRIIYDDHPSILYRQHSTNVVGVPRRRWVWRIKKLRAFRSDESRYAYREQAAEFERLHRAQIDDRTRHVLSRFLRGRLNHRAAVGYAFRPDVYRQADVQRLRNESHSFSEISALAASIRDA